MDYGNRYQGNVDVAFQQYTTLKLSGSASQQLPPDQRKAIDMVFNQVGNCERATEFVLREALMATAYVAGQQSVRWDANVGWVGQGDQTVVENQVGRVVNEIAAKISKSRPVMRSVPRNSDDSEAEKARSRSKYIEAEWYREKMVQKIFVFAKSLLTTGVAFWKVSWDANAGCEYTPTAQDQMLIDQYVEAYTQHRTAVDDGYEAPTPAPLPKWMQTRKTGANRVMPCGMHEVGFEPGCTDFSKARWAYHKTSVHIDEAFTRWPDAARFLTPDTRFYSGPLFNSVAQVGSLTGRRSPPDHVTVVEYYEVPSRRYPNGRVIQCTRDVMLHYEESIPGGRLPFAVATDNPIDSGIYGRGSVMDLIPLQRMLNQRLDYMNRSSDLGGGTLIFAKAGSIKGGSDSITDEIVQILELEGQSIPPTSINLPINPIHPALVEQARGGLLTVSGMNSISMGDVKSNTSGRLVGMLEEQTATLLGPTTRSIAGALRDVAELMLINARLFFPPSGMVHLVGTDKSLEAFEFYRGDINDVSMFIEEDSLLPRHTNYRREQVMALAQSGIMQMPPEQRRWLLKHAEFGNLDEIENANSKLEVYGREVVYYLTHRQFVKPMPPYDQTQVAAVLRDYMLTSDFRQQPDAYPAFAWYLSWCDYIEAQKQAGVAWWLIQVAEYPNPPPQPLPPQQAQVPQGPPQQAPAQEPDGDEVPQQGTPPGQIPPEMVAQLLGQAMPPGGSGGMSNAPTGATADQPAGPGVSLS